MADIKVERETINLSFHFSDSFIKRFCFSLHCSIDNLSLVKISGHFINFSLDFGFSLFNLHKLCIQIVNSCFSFSISCCKLHFGHLKLLTLGNSINFILLPIGSSVSFSFCNQSKNVLSSCSLLIECLSSTIQLMFKIPELTKKKLSFSCFIVT